MATQKPQTQPQSDSQSDSQAAHRRGVLDAIAGDVDAVPVATSCT